jgi:pimeloyl-ACP methyl ester carboxylesterase
MRVVDALGEDGKLRFWGISYGTLLGATVAALFPDRMDRVILDAVFNFHEYYNWVEPEIWSDADAIFRAMLAECNEAPKECAQSRRNQTAV